MPSIPKRRCYAWRVSGILLWAISIGCGNQDTNLPTANVGAGPGAASGSAATSKRPNSRPPEEAVDPDHPVVAIDTSMGVIEVELNREKAPITVHNFLDYAQSGHYRGTVFHYVKPAQMILGGGYTDEGGAKSVSTAIRNEADNGLANLRGTIAMSRVHNVIDSATSNFFINLVDAPQFDHSGDAAENFGYCVFGAVVKGIDVAERISKAPIGQREYGGVSVVSPVESVVIKDIRVIR